MLDIDDTTVRSLASELELLEFEKRFAFRFGIEHREFLATVANGGYPISMLAIPTENCFGGAGQLDGLFGVNHPMEEIDLGSTLARRPLTESNLVPFGFDNFGGLVLVDLAERPGRLVYIPWEEQDNTPLVTYHVADTIAEFLEEASKLAMAYVMERITEDA